MRAILLLCAAVLCAQPPSEWAIVAGRIADPSGAMVPRATVEFHPAGKIMSGAGGEYSIQLPPGVYRLVVRASGFKVYTRRKVAVRAGERAVIDITLEIAQAAERMTVTAKAPPMEAVRESEAMNWRETLEIREVRESAAKDAGEALSKVEGLWKIRKGGIANDVVLRGFQQDNINVLVDGARIYGACPNNMDPPAFHVDFAEVEQVEVTKGVFDIRNQGSLGGAVNIRSKRPEPGLNLKPGLGTGSFGFVNPSLAGSYSQEAVDVAAGYSFRRSLPFRDGAGRRFTEYANYRPAELDREAFSIGTGWFRLGFKPKANHRGQVAYTRQNGGEVLYPYLQMDALYDNADRVTASYQAGWLHLDGYFTRVRHWMTDEFRTSSVGAARVYGMGTLAATRALGGRAEATRGGFTAGVETYRRNWDAATTLRLSGQYSGQRSIPDVDSAVAGAYAQYRRTLIPTLLLTAAARVDTALMTARPSALDRDLYWAYQGANPLERRDTNPSGNVMLAWRLPRGLEVFAGAGHSVRVPDPQERYFALQRMGSDWVGNPLLRPTQNTEADFGVNYRAGRFTLRPTVFASWLADYIDVVMQPKINPLPSVMNTGARSFRNLDAAIRGGELTWSAVLHRTLLLSGGLSYVRGSKRSGGYLAEMPPLRSRTALRYGARVFFAEIENQASWRQERVDSTLREERTPGYGVVNLKAGVHSRRWNVAAGMDNILDRYYYEYLSFQRDPFRNGTRVPEPGRSLFLTAWYGF